MSRLRYVTLLILFGLPLFAADDGAATLHLSTTEARLDRERGRLTLVVRVIAKDLTTALNARLGREVAPTDPGEIAPPAADYVRETLRLQFSGIDITSTHVFLFFEAPLIGRLEGMQVANALLHDQFPDQLNTVDVHDGLGRQTLVFARDTGVLTIGKAR